MLELRTDQFAACNVIFDKLEGKVCDSIKKNISSIVVSILVHAQVSAVGMPKTVIHPWAKVLR